MLKEEDSVYLQAVKRLVNYKLMDGQRKLLMTDPDRAWLVKVQKELAQRYPDKKYELEDFGIRILRATSAGEVASWKKTEGEYSLWEVMGTRLA